MGLDDLVDEEETPLMHERKEKFREDELCPTCGEEGYDTERYYYRCTNDDCEVITWPKA